MPTATRTPSPADTLAKLEAEIANLPAEIAAAEQAGDESTLTRLLARQRILARAR